MRTRDPLKLLVIVALGVVTRVLTLSLGRADFTGWLNHSYYYFVQTRALLENGVLAYADMPLLFNLYSWIARGLSAAGLESDDAIVVSTRLVMSVVPALIPLPVYGIIKTMNGREPLRGAQWAIVAMGGFLPLSISYLPEFLQKNTLGLLLLAVLTFFSQRLLRDLRPRDVLGLTLVAVLIVLSHFGTFAAMILYGVALCVAYVAVHRALRRALLPASVLIIGGVAAVGFIYLLDAQRFRRIFVYLGESGSDSLLGALLPGESARDGALLSLAVVMLVYAILLVLYRVYRRYGDGLEDGERIFWLANIILCGLLLLPVLDEQLMSRLALFLRIPLLVLFAYVEHYALRKRWMKRGAVGLAAVALVALAFGEVMSARIHNENHLVVHADLERIAEQRLFGEDDLVITRTGAEHVCNWFYRVKAGVITSLTFEDFADYDTVYVLNPLQGSPSLEDMEGRVADTEEARYRFMLSNIPRPEAVKSVFLSDSIEVFVLERPPPDWFFTPEGRWYGYSRPDPQAPPG